MSQITRWGNSQGIRIPKRLLRIAGIEINDSVEITAGEHGLEIKQVGKKPLSWYLQGYDSDPDRYDWGQSDEPKGRELL